jgi:2-dehydro-3-deoxyphosphogluconate aldolase/(4S)-4-hydroxy-2-oxoglutarate aldolase
VTFCPTAGVSAANAPDFLALPNVAWVGGSWLTPRDAIDTGDWADHALASARAAALQRRSH